jgi:hypothetical protein
MPDIHMATARGGFTIPSRNDIHMATYNPNTTGKKAGLQLWERELLDAPEVRRKATVAQLCKICLCLVCNCGLIEHPRLLRLLFPIFRIYR